MCIEHLVCRLLSKVHARSRFFRNPGGTGVICMDDGGSVEDRCKGRVHAGPPVFVAVFRLTHKQRDSEAIVGITQKNLKSRLIKSINIYINQNQY